jgi:hypothetical protein
MVCNPNNTLAKKKQNYFCMYINSFVMIISNSHDNGALRIREGQRHMCLPENSELSRQRSKFTISKRLPFSPLQYYFSALDLAALNLEI